MENSIVKFDPQGKSVFDQKGGTLGMVIIALAIGAGLIFMNPIIELLKEAVTNLFGLICMTLLTAGVIFLIVSKDVRRMVGMLYMMGVRALMGAIIKMNPIAILEDSIVKMQKSLENINDKMNKMNGIKLKFADKIKEKKRQFQETADKYEAARQMNNDIMMATQERQMIRLEQITKEYIELHDSAVNWYNTLDKLAKYAEAHVEDASNELEIQKERYKMIKDSHSAFRSVWSIVKGDPDERATWNQAVLFISNDISERVGEMDRVCNSTGGLLDKLAIEREVYSVKGKDIAKKYQELGVDKMFENLKALPSHQMNNMLQIDGITTVMPKTTQPKTTESYF